VVVTALVPETRADAVRRTLFSETTTFGIRYYGVRRDTLARSTKTVATPYGDVAVKVGIWNGECVTVAPEYESCRKCAETSRVPLKTVYREALKTAWQDAT
jgi:hypothetical protein